MAGNRHPPSQVGEDLSRKLYFFLGNQYVRFNMLKNRAEEGYPEATSKRWAGLNFDRVGAAVYWGNAKVFFFRGRSLSRKMSHFQLWFCVVSGRFGWLDLSGLRETVAGRSQLRTSTASPTGCACASARPARGPAHAPLIWSPGGVRDFG